MQEKIKAFLDSLKSNLAGLPEPEIEEALNYYEEYLYDALDEGKDIGEMLSQMDPPEKIASMIKAETSIRKARKSPGLGNYFKVIKYALANMTKPFAILLFSLFVIVTYGTAITLFCGVIALAAGVVVISVGTIYEAFKIPAEFVAEIIGTIGIGLFAAMICLLTAFGLYKLYKLFIKISSILVGLILNKSRKQESETRERPAGKHGSARLFVKICAIIAAASLIITLATGLPTNLFMIFNSLEPLDVSTRTWEFDKTEVDNISIATAHSHIRLEKGGSDKVKIEYEQPDWTEPEITLNEGRLTFVEKPNGRLPLFFLVSMHENRTDVVITLPDGLEPSELVLESRGGFIHINTLDFNTFAKTYTGNIYLESKSDDETASIAAMSRSGSILVNGVDAGRKGPGGSTYEITSQSGAKIELETSRGDIHVR